MIKRAYYDQDISGFLAAPDNLILGELTRNSAFDIVESQKNAWLDQMTILRNSLQGLSGKIYFEYSIPRMGRRIDVLLLLKNVIFVVEFKVGEDTYPACALDQVFDYALDLKNFHEGSHACAIIPVLLSTEAPATLAALSATPQNDKLFAPVCANPNTFRDVLQAGLQFVDAPDIQPEQWEQSRYCPTPTIVEAAMALYGGHAVAEISRSDAGAINLHETSDAISQIIEQAKRNSQKVICFVTGVPGAGKTLVGLNIATKHVDKNNDLYSVFLSGNGPLVAVLHEALARDQIRRQLERNKRMKKHEALSEVKAFIQNVHHFRDEGLKDDQRPPVEHVALFDEAQRAWDLQQTASFMARKKGRSNFKQSEPEFLIACMDRHADWAVIVCLVGGGQEINTGEAGIGEWIESLNRSFPNWNIHISPNLTDSEYGAGDVLKALAGRAGVTHNEKLHLSVSMRSFRAEHVSAFVKQLLDCRIEAAQSALAQIKDKYPIVLTRDLAKAKAWLREHARGSERYGIVVSSQAERLKPHAIDVRSPVDPVHWFLDDKDDVRSSYYLEDVATEFDVQGLELDWACVTWDGDFRYTPNGWQHYSFKGSKWQNVRQPVRQTYLKNAYRVLLTRARQGMVIVVPHGDVSDHTRPPKFYDPTFEWLKSIGIPMI
jgi:hypothetical protein